MAVLNVLVYFAPIKFGLKEKILCLKYFRDNSTIRNLLKNDVKTEEEKLSGLREHMKIDMELKMFNELFKLKKKGDIEDYEMLFSDNPKEIRFKMIGSEEMVKKWEKDWKNKLRIIHPTGFSLKLIGLKVETTRGEKDE